MSAKIERGKPLFVLFCDGISVSDAHGKPRIYKTRRGFETRCPEDDRCATGAELVEYREVRHGRWIPQDATYTRFMCSACKSRNNAYRTDYCPDCGTKMDKEAI